MSQHQPAVHRLFVKAAVYVLLAFILAFPERSMVAQTDPGTPASETDGRVTTPATFAYARQVTKLIKAAWSRSIEKSTSTPYGSVVVHAKIDRSGNVINPRIVSGATDKGMRRIVLQAVQDTCLPAMSDEAIRELGGKFLALDITFDLRPDPVEEHAPR